MTENPMLEPTGQRRRVAVRKSGQSTSFKAKENYVLNIFSKTMHASYSYDYSIRA